MSSENDRNTRLVPAICTQCGASLEVDPSQEAAVCRYCNTPFIVEKAVRNYNIQQAKIEHADTVNIQMKGTAESFFGFLGSQLSERRAIRREERKEQREQEREMQKRFFKLFGLLAIAMLVFAMVMFIFQGLTGGFDDDADEGAAGKETAFFVSPADTQILEVALENAHGLSLDL